MTVLALAVGVAVWNRKGLRSGAAAFLLIRFPAIGAAAVTGWWLWHRYRPKVQPDVGRVARLTGLALRSGMALPNALALAGSESGQPEQSAVTHLLRRAGSMGIGPALASTVGPLGPMARRLSAAHHTGAPLAAAVEAIEHELCDVRRTRILARVRRLPIQLALPLVLLILPGSILLLVGPRILAELSRLTAPFGALGP